MCYGYLWAPRYWGVIVHTQPAAHSISEDGDHVPLTDNNVTLTNYLSSSCTTVKPEGKQIKYSVVTYADMTQML